MDFLPRGSQQLVTQSTAGRTQQFNRQSAVQQVSAIPSIFPQPPSPFSATNAARNGEVTFGRQASAPGAVQGVAPAAAGRFRPVDLYSTQANGLPQSAATSSATGYRPNTDPGYDPRPRVRYRGPNSYAAARPNQGPLSQPQRRVAAVPPAAGPSFPGPSIPGNVRNNVPGNIQGNIAGPSRDIAEVQEMLIRLGMQPGPVDDVMKPETAQAVRTYAAIVGLASDGTITPNILNRLRQDTGTLGGNGAARGPARGFGPARGSGPALYGPAPTRPITASPISYRTGPNQPAFANRANAQQAYSGPATASQLASPATVGEVQRALAEYQARRGLVTDGQISGPFLAQLRADAVPNAIKRTGPTQNIGNGQVSTYVEYGPDGVPISVGVLIGADAIAGFTQQARDQRRCADFNGDGQRDPNSECLAMAELNLRMPAPANGEVATPISWVSLNWLPQGHRRINSAGVAPASTANWPAALAQPHLGIHFYLQDFEIVQTIGPGPCGGMIDCALLARATAPLPPQFMPVGYVNVGGAIAFMGNHLIDATAPAFAATNSTSFTHGFTFGSYNGALTFFEPKVTLETLTNATNTCFPISQPMAYAQAGLYPTAYCVRRRPETNGVSVSLEGLIFHQAAQQIASR